MARRRKEVTAVPLEPLPSAGGGIIDNARYRLMLGDCLDEMKRIPAGSVDLVLCDLPYGTTACPWDIVIPFASLWEHYERVCKPSGLVVLFGSEPFSTEMRHSNLQCYRYDLVWVKDAGSNFMSANIMPMKRHETISVFFASRQRSDTTNFFQASKDYLIGEKEKAEAAGYNMRDVLGNYMGSHYFTRKTQFAFPTRAAYEKLQTTGFFSRDYDDAKREYDGAKGVVTYNPQFSEGTPYRTVRGRSAEVHGAGLRGWETNNDGRRYPTSVVKFNRERGYHPTQKPVALLEYLIKTYTNEDEVVLDNCMGSGSTGVACMNTGRRFIGIELDDGYFEIAQKRIEGAA